MNMMQCRRKLYKKLLKKENPPATQPFKEEKPEDVIMITYKELYVRDKNPEWARKKIYQYTKTHTLSETAAKFGCHINTVKKIKKRGNENEFSNRSRARKRQPHRISDKKESYILACREDRGMGPLNLKHQYGIDVSVSTIYRCLTRHKKIKHRRRKWKRSRDLRAYKQTKKMFEHIQVDGKLLTDIVEFYPYYSKFDLPKLQFTFTCQKSGAAFFAYSKSESMTAGMTFIIYVFEHLKQYGIDVKSITVKTDQGSYAIGSARSFKKSSFTNLIQQTYKAKHRVNKHKNQNSDVERFHGLIEDYFYKQTIPNSKQDFFKKAMDTQIWFNYIRKNGSKNWKTPLDFLKEDYPDIDPQVLALAPVNLDAHLDLYLYKTDPSFMPTTKYDWFRDFNCFSAYSNLDNLEDDLEYFFGDAKKSSFLGHDVVKLDENKKWSPSLKGLTNLCCKTELFRSPSKKEAVDLKYK